jgi:hypothetical protein
MNIEKKMFCLLRDSIVYRPFRLDNTYFLSYTQLFSEYFCIAH